VRARFVVIGRINGQDPPQTRIVLGGLRGEHSIAELCEREGRALGEAPVDPTVSSLGNSYENALAKTQRSLQSRDHPSARTVAVVRSRQVRDAGMGGLVQQLAAP
jgi:hypothetical protein